MSDDETYRAKTSRALWAKLKPLAREMRHEPTPAEHLLWQRLRGRRIQGAKFRRQHVIERFIVDFYCAEANLIIEVDGAIHDYTPEEDAVRQAFLESMGFRIIRITNNKVIQSPDSVAERIGDGLTDMNEVA